MTSTALQNSSERTRSIAYCALSIALLAVGAWVTVPLGPVPFTLQVFVAVFIMLALEPKLALLSMAGYVAIGAIGVPVFSAMRGGIGVLAGPTGGFIWGMLLGMALALLLGRAFGSGQGASAAQGRSGFAPRELLRGFAMAFAFLACVYLCGWAQLMAVLALSPEAAFASAVAPFILVDIAKIVAAVLVALAVKRALAA